MRQIQLVPSSVAPTLLARVVSALEVRASPLRYNKPVDRPPAIRFG
jgi:hypothetical protein